MKQEESLSTTYKSHIESMEKKIRDFYTIDTPSDYHRKDNQIVVSEELEKANQLEKVYSVIVQNGHKEGEIYESYSTYLNNVKKGISILEREKEKIDEKHGADIKNAQLIISVMKKYLN